MEEAVDFCFRRMLTFGLQQNPFQFPPAIGQGYACLVLENHRGTSANPCSRGPCTESLK